MLEALKKLVEENTTKISKLTFDISSPGSLNDEIKQFFRDNPFEITEVCLNFTNNEELSLDERCRITVEFIETLKHINGIKSFKLNAAVKDYVLNELLVVESLANLESLELTHQRRDPSDPLSDMINSSVLFTAILPLYLTKNKALQSLTIYDTSGDITAASYARFKKAMIDHPRLSSFYQGYINLFEHRKVLSEDASFIDELAQKNKPQVNPKILIENAEKEAKDILRSLDKNLDETINMRHQIWPNENSWAFTVSLLQVYLDKLKNQHMEFVESNLESDEPALIKVLHNYITLLQYVAYIHSKAPHISDLERFWDITRKEMLADIQRVEDNDYSSVTDTMKAHAQKFERIYDRALNKYPISYTTVTSDANDSLLKAKELLEDYTKHNSAASRFFHGHWNRHHVQEVNNLVMRINSAGDHAINSLEDLVAELKKIPLANENGSLAKRIQFIIFRCQPTEENSDALQVSM